MTKLIIDADTGSDDAVALIMAYRNVPIENILGVSIVAGNVPLEQGLINTNYVNELCDVSIPVYKGAEKPLLRDYLEVHDAKKAKEIALSYQNQSMSAQYVHGVDGVGDVGIKPSKNFVQNISAREFYREALSKNDSVDIVALGPLTNIAHLVQDNQKNLNKINHLYVMGGSSNALGNTTKFAEYNFWVDPEAADIVLNSGIPITMIGWDPSLYDAMIDVDKIVEIESLDTKYSKYTSEIHTHIRKFMIEAIGQDCYGFPDPLAMSVYLDKEIISESTKVNVRVDTRDGMTRGGCILDYPNLEPESPKILVVQRCHHDKFYNLLLNSLN